MRGRAGMAALPLMAPLAVSGIHGRHCRSVTSHAGGRLWVGDYGVGSLFDVPPHFHSRISGISSPYLLMYCLCSISEVGQASDA
jgi:hypothetical protein